jgi:hypothetical protein
MSVAAFLPIFTREHTAGSRRYVAHCAIAYARDVIAMAQKEERAASLRRVSRMWTSCIWLVQLWTLATYTASGERKQEKCRAASSCLVRVSSGRARGVTNTRQNDGDQDGKDTPPMYIYNRYLRLTAPSCNLSFSLTTSIHPYEMPMPRLQPRGFMGSG